MTLIYKTELRDTRDGKATYGAAFVQMRNGGWALIGHTRNYATYSRMVRAAANNLCKRHSRRMFEMHPSLLTLPQPIEIQEG